MRDCQEIKMTKKIESIFKKQDERIKEERLLYVFDQISTVLKNNNIDPCSLEHYSLIFMALKTNLAIAYEYDPKVAWSHFKECVAASKQLWDECLELVAEAPYIED